VPPRTLSVCPPQAPLTRLYAASLADLPPCLPLSHSIEVTPVACYGLTAQGIIQSPVSIFWPLVAV